jgi:hypothetical protein
MWVFSVPFQGNPCLDVLEQGSIIDYPETVHL